MINHITTATMPMMASKLRAAMGPMIIKFFLPDLRLPVPRD
jgi:hypothetical protein